MAGAGMFSKLKVVEGAIASLAEKTATNSATHRTDANHRRQEVNNLMRSLA
jgi:hypothetical protein